MQAQRLRGEMIESTLESIIRKHDKFMSSRQAILLHFIVQAR